MIVILSDSEYGLPIDQLLIEKISIQEYKFDDPSWYAEALKIDLLIIVYKNSISFSKEVEVFKNINDRGAILLVCLASKEDYPQRQEVSDLIPVFLPKEKLQFNRRILSHLACRYLKPNRTVFISYRTKHDKEIATPLVKALKKYDYKISWDREWEEYTQSSDMSDDKHKEIINKYLSKAAILIVINSKETQNSQWVGYEVEQAISSVQPIKKLSFYNQCDFMFLSGLESCFELENIAQLPEAIESFEVYLGAISKRNLRKL